MTKPAYLQYLQLAKSSLTTVNGLTVPVWELSIPSDGACLASWGHHFRQHYCLDAEIDDFRAGTGLTRSEYLLNYVFPDGKEKPGPFIRSGDFGELLISDYLEFIMGYWVPRGVNRMLGHWWGPRNRLARASAFKRAPFGQPHCCELTGGASSPADYRLQRMRCSGHGDRAVANHV